MQSKRHGSAAHPSLGGLQAGADLLILAPMRGGGGGGTVRALAAGVALCAAVQGCAFVARSRPGAAASPRPPAPAACHVQTGMASWYGPGFHGGSTASGETYDQHALTAAHPTLPLGVRASVTNLRNDRRVEVRINDRGPYARDRAVDLSYAAARAIGVVGPGTAPVRIEVKRCEPWRSLDLKYAVQVGSFSDPARAAWLRSRLQERFDDVYVSPRSVELQRYYQVRLGPFDGRGEAGRRAVVVSGLGLPALVVEETDYLSHP